MAANGMHEGYGRNMEGMQEGCTRHTQEVHEGTRDVQGADDGAKGTRNAQLMSSRWDEWGHKG